MEQQHQQHQQQQQKRKKKSGKGNPAAQVHLHLCHRDSVASAQPAQRSGAAAQVSRWIHNCTLIENLQNQVDLHLSHGDSITDPTP
jgi:hypothetical protein